MMMIIIIIIILFYFRDMAHARVKPFSLIVYRKSEKAPNCEITMTEDLMRVIESYLTYMEECEVLGGPGKEEEVEPGLTDQQFSVELNRVQRNLIRLEMLDKKLTIRVQQRGGITERDDIILENLNILGMKLRDLNNDVHQAISKF